MHVSRASPTLKDKSEGITPSGRPTWRVVLLQTTPAAFHGRPDLAEALTRELRQLL